MVKPVVCKQECQQVSLQESQVVLPQACGKVWQEG